MSGKLRSKNHQSWHSLKECLPGVRVCLQLMPKRRKLQAKTHVSPTGLHPWQEDWPVATEHPIIIIFTLNYIIILSVNIFDRFVTLVFVQNVIFSCPHLIGMLFIYNQRNKGRVTPLTWNGSYSVANPTFDM